MQVVIYWILKVFCVLIIFSLFYYLSLENKLMNFFNWLIKVLFTIGFLDWGNAYESAHGKYKN